MAILVPPYEISEKLGHVQISLPAENVESLLKVAQAKYGELFSGIEKKVFILVNGRNITYLEGLKTPLSETDQVWLVKYSAGG